MWMRETEYEGIKFYLFGDWFGVDGFKVCLAVGEENTTKALTERSETIIEALQFYAENAEELMLVGWSSDSIFWWHSEREELDEYERRASIIYNSQFSDKTDKAEAAKALRSIAEHRKKKRQKQIKRQIARRRRSDFAKERDRLMLALIERDGCECSVCGEIEDLAIDHIIPLSKGGSDELDNLQLLCPRHNSAKGDRMPEG